MCTLMHFVNKTYEYHCDEHHLGIMIIYSFTHTSEQLCSVPFNALSAMSFIYDHSV